MESLLKFFSTKDVEKNAINLVEKIILPIEWNKSQYRWRIGEYVEEALLKLNNEYDSEKGGFKLQQTEGFDLLWKQKDEKNVRISVKSSKNLLLFNKTKPIIIKNTIGNCQNTEFEWDAMIVIGAPDVKKIYSDICFGLITRQSYDSLSKKINGANISVQIPFENFNFFVRKKFLFINNNHLEDITKDCRNLDEQLKQIIFKKNEINHKNSLLTKIQI